MRKKGFVYAGLIAVLVFSAWAFPQRGRARLRETFESWTNSEVDQRKFTFVRVKFTMKNVQYNQVWLPPWAHDIPRADRHLMKIMQEFTDLETNEDSIVLTLDNPELFKYPFAYICEVGFFDPTPAEIEGLREYLQRGGFLIVDDFGDNFWWSDDWVNFEAIMKRVFPNRQMKQVDIAHPLFHSFFDMKNIDFPNYRGMGKYYVLEDDAGRACVIANFNNDIGEYWEWSDTSGYFGVDLTNEAFKLGVNYLVYALSH